VRILHHASALFQAIDSAIPRRLQGWTNNKIKPKRPPNTASKQAKKAELNKAMQKFYHASNVGSQTVVPSTHKQKSLRHCVRGYTSSSETIAKQELNNNQTIMQVCYRRRNARAASAGRYCTALSCQDTISRLTATTPAE
jgi:hypothetical protein